MSHYSFATLPTSLHELLDAQARRFGESTYAIFEDREWSYATIGQMSRDIAARLKAAGVHAGDRVMLLMPSSVTYLGLWFGISRVGAVESPVNPAYKGSLLKQLIETSSPKLCIIDGDHLEEFRVAGDGLIAPEMIISTQMFLSISGTDEPAERAHEAGGRDTAAIIFTSGTTGRSKGVMVSHRQQLGFGQAFAEITSLSKTDTTYNFLPFFHIAAKFVALGTLLTGGKMLLRPGFSVSNFWSDVRRHGVTVCQAVGGLCHMLNSQPRREAESDNPMRMIYTVPLPWEFKSEFEERFGLTLVEGYGGTECNLVAYSRPDEDTPRGSCGRASPHFEVVIQDEEGNIAPHGQAGEICVRPRFPATMMNGYFGEPQKSLEVMGDFWFHTGDRGVMNADGYFFFLDRLKDAIRRRGENISSFEVERILNGHPAIAESAVVPVPSEIGEDEVKAILVLKPQSTASEQDIFHYAMESMPYFMVPRFIEIRNQLPRTPTMKIKKADLKAEGNNDSTWDCEKVGLRVTRHGATKSNPRRLSD